MSEIADFRAIIDLWPSRIALASELGHADADTAWTVCGWHKRRSIPSSWWIPIAALPLAVANGVTVELMADLAARRAAERRDRLEVA